MNAFDAFLQHAFDLVLKHVARDETIDRFEGVDDRRIVLFAGGNGAFRQTNVNEGKDI